MNSYRSVSNSVRVSTGPHLTPEGERCGRSEALRTGKLGCHLRGRSGVPSSHTTLFRPHCACAHTVYPGGSGGSTEDMAGFEPTTSGFNPRALASAIPAVSAFVGPTYTRNPLLTRIVELHVLSTALAVQQPRYRSVVARLYGRQQARVSWRLSRPTVRVSILAIGKSYVARARGVKLKLNRPRYLSVNGGDQRIDTMASNELLAS